MATPAILRTIPAIMIAVSAAPVWPQTVQIYRVIPLKEFILTGDARLTESTEPFHHYELGILELEL